MKKKEQSDIRGERYESLKSKLIKLQALAERGYEGEAENAKRLIQKLCAENGVSIEEILQEQIMVKRYSFEVGRNKLFIKLFTHCFAKLTNVGTLKYFQESRNTISVELTPMQYLELKNMFEWHKENFIRDLDELQNNVFAAYVNKHDLFSHSESDNDDEEKNLEPLTPEMYRKLMAIFAIQQNLNDNSYHKMLE